MNKAFFLQTTLMLMPFMGAEAQTNFTPQAVDSLGRAGILSRNGSVDVVTEDRMNKGLVTNSLSALSGQSAGVNITSGENRMAQLSSVRVRGTTSLTGGNDPLVIIDGVYSDLSTLSSIYPADIASFAILKNAAETAQYGSRGASGVIQVTTKKGTGSQFHISYDGNIGFESKYKTVEMLDGPSYVSTAQSLGLDYNDGGYNTNFQDVITRTGFVMNHHVAFSGGGEKASYRASIGLMDHLTVLRVNEYRNFIAKFDLSQKAFDDLLQIDFGVFGSSQRNKYPFDEQKLFYSAATQNPTFPAGTNSSGGWDKNTTASQINPPGALLKEKNDEKNLNFDTHLSLDFDLLGFFSGGKREGSAEQLHAKIFGAYTYNSLENAQFCPTWVWAQGQAYRGEHKQEDMLGNLSLNYQNTWGAHHLGLTLLGEYQKSKRTGFWTLVKGFTTNVFGYDNLGAASTIPYGGTGSDSDEPSMASVLGGLSYTYLDRYTFEANIRADGSSMFGDNNKWGYFPSVSASWDIAKEPFFEPLRHAISMFTFRIGWGESGNSGGIDSYNSLQLVRPIGTVSVDGTPTTTMGVYRNANPDLKWETRSTFNIGTDLCFWQNRMVLTAEYYYSKTRDMLYMYDVPVPPFTYDKMLANLGKMSNQGFELGVGITAIQERDMELNINVNLSWQKNKLISLSGDYNGTYLSAAEITSIGSLNGAGFHGGDNNIVYQIVGQSLGVFYLPHCTGLTQNEDGSYSYAIEDIDQNGRVNIEDGGDRYIAGQATPKWTLGSNISFRYKDFDISLQMNGAFGHKIYNGTALTYMNMSSFPDYNVMKDAPEQNIKDQTATDYWLEKGDYLNFDYLTVGWNVPIRSRYVSGLRVSLSVNNLATITSYSGITPMINSYDVNSTLGIDDKRSYPAYRSYSLGISLQF
jgi:TonB-linked SusC/RagA family outer membrane protein